MWRIFHGRYILEYIQKIVAMIYPIWMRIDVPIYHGYVEIFEVERGGLSHLTMRLQFQFKMVMKRT